MKIQIKVVAINTKTGSKYVYCKKTKYGEFYHVSTIRGGGQTWLVDGSSIKLL